MSRTRAAMQGLFDLGKPIKSRSGWIWELNNSNQILKVTHDPDLTFVKKFNQILSHLQKIDNPSVVKIYKYGTVPLKNNEPFHFHVMEKLISLPKDIDAANIFIDSVSSYYNNRKAIPYFLSDNMISFISNLRKLKYKYYDLHCDNIMQDQNGNFKLIDLEAFLD